MDYRGRVRQDDPKLDCSQLQQLPFYIGTRLSTKLLSKLHIVDDIITI